MKKSGLLICLSAAAVTLSVVLFTAGCHKGNSPEDTGYAADHATSEQTFNDVQAISDNAANVSAGPLGYKTSAGGCATVTKTPPTPTTPGVMTIDFGSSDCTCHDGRKRRGKIIVSYTGGYADSGSVHTITFDNFYQNDNKVTGTKTVTNMGHNSSGQPYFNIHVSGSVTLNGGGTVSATWDRVRTWTAGYNTPTYMDDDVYQITGSGTLTRANGKVINISITAPLVIANNCKWIEAGSVTFEVATGQSRVVNYGDVAACDDQATVTLANGTKKDITLP